MWIACHLWPSISPFGPDHANSIFWLPLQYWLMAADQVDDYVANRSK